MKNIFLLLIIICAVDAEAQSTFTYDASGNQITRTRPSIIQGITTVPDIQLNAGQQTLLWATGGISYLWSTGDTTAQISVAPPVTTTYTVAVRCACGTVQENQITVTVLPVTAAEEAGEAVAFSVSPNPASDRLQVRISLPEAADIEVRLLDIQGRAVWRRHVSGAECHFEQECRNLAKGVYRVHFTYRGHAYSRTLIVLGQ